jgi:hypothetical protein
VPSFISRRVSVFVTKLKSDSNQGEKVLGLPPILSKRYPPVANSLDFEEKKSY